MAVEEDEEEDSDQEDDEAMDQEDTTTTTVPSTPTGLIPTIDQLFKRSFSQELAELANSSSNSNHHQLCEDMLRASPADQQLVMLEDIQQILRDTTRITVVRYTTRILENYKLLCVVS